MSDTKPRPITGSSIAEIAGNILSGMMAASIRPSVGVARTDLADADQAFRLAVYIAEKAEAYDAERAGRHFSDT